MRELKQGGNVMRRAFVLFAAVLILGTVYASADTNGRLTGLIEDNEGVALPGVTVIISSDNLIGGQQTAVSDLDGPTERVEPEHLRPDVGMDADQFDGRRGLGTAHRGLGDPGGDGETELGVVLAGGDELVGVGLDAGRDAHECRRHLARGCVDGLDPVDLVEAVDDDAGHPGIERSLQLGTRLVVAVQHQVRARHVDVTCDIWDELSRGRTTPWT